MINRYYKILQLTILSVAFIVISSVTTHASDIESVDFNHDNSINIFDYNILVNDFGTKYDIFDYNKLVSNFDKTVTISSLGENKIVDSEFDLINHNITNKNINNGGTKISPNWIVKAGGGAVTASTSNISNGIQITANYSPTKGYVYVRQIIPNVYQFENKTITLEVEYTNDTGKELLYDVYIQARFNPDNSTRTLVTDTPAYVFKTGTHLVKHTFNVPDFNGKEMKETEGLSVAFRVIGQNKTGNFKIHTLN